MSQKHCHQCVCIDRSDHFSAQEGSSSILGPRCPHPTHTHGYCCWCIHTPLALSACAYLPLPPLAVPRHVSQSHDGYLPSTLCLSPPPSSVPPYHCPFLSCLPSAASELRDNFEAGHVCWDDHDLSTLSGRPTGAVRATLGALSTFEEVHLLLQLVQRYFVVNNAGSSSSSSSSSSPSLLSDGRLVVGRPVAASTSSTSSPSSLSNSRRVVRRPAGGPASVPETLHSGGSCDPHLGATARQMGSADGNDHEEKLHRGTLTHMFVYPIKSCAGQQVGIGRNGSRCLSTLTHN